MTRKNHIRKSDPHHRDDEITFQGHTGYFAERDMNYCFAIKHSDKPEAAYPTPLVEGDYLRIFLDENRTKPMIGGFLVAHKSLSIPRSHIHPLYMIVTEQNDTSLAEFFTQNKQQLFNHNPRLPVQHIHSRELQDIFSRTLPVLVSRTKESRVIHHFPDHS